MPAQHGGTDSDMYDTPQIRPRQLRPSGFYGPCATTAPARFRGAAPRRDRNRGNDLLTGRHTPDVTATARYTSATRERF